MVSRRIGRAGEATIAVSQTIPQAPVRRAGSHDRVFYGDVAMPMALTAIVGFAPTFYLRRSAVVQWRPSVVAF